MLIGFKVKNFRSFDEEQSFSFCTSSDITHAATHCVATGMKSVRRLSKAAIIFGANGSGKTNLIAAFATMRALVLRSTSYSQAEFAACHTPFPSGPSSGETEFEIDLLLDKTRYRYGFSYDADSIRTERLAVYCSGKSQRWFERTRDGKQDLWSPFSQNFSGPRGMWRDATRPQALFLTTAAQLNSDQLWPLFHWFEHGMELIFGSAPLNLSRLATSIKDATFKRRMLQFLQSADIRVHDVRASETASDRPMVEFLHLRGASQVWLRAADESTGLQRLASLFGPLWSAIEQGKLLLIDEFDLGLHPLAARYLLQCINESSVADCRAQLLLTSHDATLMDVNILRRDEIWLMSLDDNDASQLAPVWHSAAPPRKHELIGKAYLRGRYGAIPTVRSEFHRAASDNAPAKTQSQAKALA